MVLSPELLDKARAAGAKLEGADRQALLARADYNTAVRRLHLAGGSLREIAQALSLSHQRVQQIVSGAGGSWWRRVWRTRTIRPDAVCTWCGRPPGEVSKLIAGPNVFICDACVESAERMAGGQKPAGPFAALKTAAASTPGISVKFAATIGKRCAFCGKRQGGDRSLVAAPAGNVCTDCLKVCRDIIDASNR